MTDSAHITINGDIQRKIAKILAFFAGIVLPAAALGVELVTRIWTDWSFDPVPTFWHGLLIACVPTANLAACLARDTISDKTLAVLGYANGLVIGVALFYTLLFLPVLPLSVVAVIVYGLGLLPLAPLLSCLAAIYYRRQLNKIAAATGRGLPRVWRGVALGLGLLIAFEMPTTITRLGMHWAAADSVDSQSTGIRLLRLLGSDDTMLRLCYGRSTMATDLGGFLFALGRDPILPAEARKIYYRVTGEPFNSVPPPKRGSHRRWGDFAFDAGLGGETVAGRVKGLSLNASRLDGSLDPDAALGYLEWTMVFKNSSQRQREARAQLLLPPGGVVSRLTLWVNGEEREAAFAGRGKVRQAYSRVVRQRRDPVLVTTCGPDRVLVQCFPVPSGGEMKIRLGITTPLHLETRKEAILLPPRFLERNFAIPDQVRHSLWLESPSPLSGANPDLILEHPDDALYALRGGVSDSDLSGAGLLVRAQRAAEKITAWGPDMVDKKGLIVRQVLEQHELSRPERVILVIDGSRSMAPFVSAIADALAGLPTGIEFGIVLAGDQVKELATGLQQSSSETLQQAGHRLRDQHFKGGRDNVPALLRGLELANGNGDSAVVWLHGPQPVLLQGTESIGQFWQRRPGSSPIIDIQLASGPNRVVESPAEPAMFRTLPRLSSIDRDLHRLFAGWDGRYAPITFKRSKRAASKIDRRSHTKQTSTHLARLWAHNEVLRLAAKADGRDKAVRLATAYQLVTPVSGAVVLETRQQYDAAGLEPGDGAGVPTIPEPETIFLMAIAALLLLCTIFRRRLPCNSAPIC